MVVKSFIGMIVPFTVGRTLVRSKSAVIVLIYSMIMLVELLLRSASASPKIGCSKGSPSGLTSVVAKSSARRTSTHVVAAKAGFEASIETSSKVPVVYASASSVILASVLWIQRAVLPKVRAFVSPAGLIAFLIIPLPLNFFKFLQFGLCLFF